MEAHAAHLQALGVHALIGSSIRGQRGEGRAGAPAALDLRVRLRSSRHSAIGQSEAGGSRDMHSSPMHSSSIAQSVRTRAEGVGRETACSSELEQISTTSCSSPREPDAIQISAAGMDNVGKG